MRVPVRTYQPCYCSSRYSGASCCAKCLWSGCRSLDSQGHASQTQLACSGNARSVFCWWQAVENKFTCTKIPTEPDTPEADIRVLKSFRSALDTGGKVSKVLSVEAYIWKRPTFRKARNGRRIEQVSSVDIILVQWVSSPAVAWAFAC
jgi:hypothetical protein